MPTPKFRNPPDNPASFKNRPPGSPTLVKRVLPPKKAAVSTDEPPTFQKAIDILASTHDMPELAKVGMSPEAELVNWRDTRDVREARDIVRELNEGLDETILPETALSACIDNQAVASSDVAAITPRHKRKYQMAETNVPTQLIYHTNLDPTEYTLNLDAKARKGMTSVVFTDSRRGSVRVAKSRFSTATEKVAKAKMSEEEKKAARAAGREKVKSLSEEELIVRENERHAAKVKKILAARAAKGELVSA